jgi:ubiquinone/menaquinone biosynthesis C-methylase UbiE
MRQDPGMPYLTSEQARRTYDRIGRLQDVQLYEARAVRALVAEAGLRDAHAVVEIGCGTGALARRLLERELPADARYLGLDLSPRMISIARRRLARYGARARVELADAAERVPAEDGWADRVVAAYLLDLLPPERTAAVLAEAARVLAPGGLLCVAALASGRGFAGRLLTAAWERLWELRPQLVGGCCPSELPPLLAGPEWQLRSVRRFTQLGIASQVVVAARAG